jgi:SAM-dependent methyltransferase
MRILHQVAKSIALRFDEKFGTSIKQDGGNFYRLLLGPWSQVRRRLDPMIIRLLYGMKLRTERELRLHLGCGWKHLEGYINVDLWITDATDVICDISRLPWPDSSVARIESYHVIEHISHKKIKKTLNDWHRVLKPEGILILECPHFDEAFREYLSGDESRLLNIFGRQRFPGDTHFYGFNPKRLRRLLEGIGFKEFQETPPQSSQTLDEPCFRLECKNGE